MAQSEVEMMRARQSATYTAVRTKASAAYRGHVEPLGYQDATPGALTAAIVAALHTLAQCWREDATWTTEQRKKGHVSTAAELRQAAARVAGAAVELSTQQVSDSRPTRAYAPDQDQSDINPTAQPIITASVWPNGNYCGARPLGPGADDDGACIRPPHASDAQSSHVNIRGDRWPNVVAPADTELPSGQTDAPEPAAVVTFLDPDIPPEGDIMAPAFLEPDIPFSAGPRLSVRDVSGPVMLAAGQEWPKHRSVSQIETYGDCSLKYRLQRYHPDVHQVPNWASVGGRALHTAIAAHEFTDIESVNWDTAFEAEISNTETTSGVPRSAWRVSGRGKENYDWWRVEGADMLERYIQWSRDAGPIYDGMVEHEFEVSIAGVQVKGIIDQVREEAPGQLHVIDVKTGRIPTDFFQLAIYGSAVHHATRPASVMMPGQLFGSFWNARTGELTSIDIWERYSGEEIAYRVSTMDAAERAGIYLPSPSTFCVACPVGHACPVNPRR